MSMTSLPGIAELRADRGGQAIAHRAEPARGQPAVRRLEVEMLRRPHLVLADLGGDDRHRRAGSASYSRSIARCGMISVVAVGKSRLLRARQPSIRATIRRDRACGWRCASRRAIISLEHVGRHRRRSAGRRGTILVDRRAVDIDVDLRRMSGANASSRPVTRSSKRAPSADDQVGLVHRHDWLHRCRACRACRAIADASAGKAPRPIRVEVTGAPVSACELAQQLARRGPGIDDARRRYRRSAARRSAIISTACAIIAGSRLRSAG